MASAKKDAAAVDAAAVDAAAVDVTDVVPAAPLTDAARLTVSRQDLEEGLAAEVVRSRLAESCRMGELGQRMLAFYLVEMDERRLYQDTGHNSTFRYAEGRLELDPRRVRELLVVGRALVELPEIDRAFCRQEIGWSKLLLLTRVATPQHELAWLEQARRLTVRQLRNLVKQSTPGQAPRAPGDKRGHAEVRYRHTFRVGALGHRAIELAQRKLADELGESVSEGDLLVTLAEMFIGSDAEADLEGRKRAGDSLFKIVVHEHASGELQVETNDGLVPVDGGEEDPVRTRARSACARCDGEHVDLAESEGEATPSTRDIPTPPALRKRVLARDGQQCRCCGSRHRLQVHHIRFRSHGGRTVAANLVTLCVRCHELVHAGLLVVLGRHAERVTFVDAALRPLAPPKAPIPPAALIALERAHSAQSPENRPRIPAERPADATMSPVVTPARAAVPFREAFAGIAGLDTLLERLETASEGAIRRGRAFPHVLFVGPPGTGKTSLARALAAHAGVRLVEALGPFVQTVSQVQRLVGSLAEGDMLFLDEVHAVPRVALESLYQRLTERRPAGARGFTLLAATSEEREVPVALASRFGMVERLGYYETEDLARIAAAQAARDGYTLEAEAARCLARAGSGTPREVLRLLQRVLDDVAVRGADKRVDLVRVQLALARLGYDSSGLCPGSQAYLKAVREAGGPLGVSRLSHLLGVSIHVLTRHIEPGLVRRGLIRITPRGRSLPRPVAEVAPGIP